MAIGTSPGRMRRRDSRRWRGSVPAQPAEVLGLELCRRLLEVSVRPAEQPGPERAPFVFLPGRLGAQVGVGLVLYAVMLPAEAADRRPRASCCVGVEQRAEDLVPVEQR